MTIIHTRDTWGSPLGSLPPPLGSQGSLGYHGPGPGAPWGPWGAQGRCQPQSPCGLPGSPLHFFVNHFPISRCSHLSRSYFRSCLSHCASCQSSYRNFLCVTILAHPSVFLSLFSLVGGPPSRHPWPPAPPALQRVAQIHMATSSVSRFTFSFGPPSQEAILRRRPPSQETHGGGGFYKAPPS